MAKLSAVNKNKRRIKLSDRLYKKRLALKKIVMEKLYKKRFSKILPKNKLEQMCMERLFGIAFQQEGYDASNSIQGEHFTTPFETFNFQKKFFKRK